MKTLIVYATKYGCTEKCATILSEKLKGDVALKNIKVAGTVDLVPYDKVIIGGSIYAGKIQREISDFCLKNMHQLKPKKVGLFVCGMLSDQAEMELNSSFPQELLANAIAKDFFGGEFRFKKMNFLERLIVKKVAKDDKNLPALDTGKDVSTISEDIINRFAQLMNNSL